MSVSRRDFLLFAATATGICLAAGAPEASAAKSRDGGVKKACAAIVAHFSPTGSTAMIANRLGAALADAVTGYDLTGQTLEARSFDGAALAVVAVPVYMGRVPTRAAEALRLCSGNGMPCVSVAVCGNRAIDDALLELNDILAEQGFTVIASGGFVGQHALAAEIAAGRPDTADLAVLDGFAAAVLEATARGSVSGPPKVPGNRPYRTLPSPAAVPVVSNLCIACGECAQRCPVAAISMNDFRSTDQGKCILCMRCVQRCPVGARALPAEFREKLQAYMQRYKARLEPKTYL